MKLIDKKLIIFKIQRMFKQVILFGFIAAFLGLSQTAGVGGGPIVNICLMICMGYDAKLSISVTYIFLIGGSIASIWKNSQKKDPKTGKSAVNLDLILLTIPTMTSGSLFGGVVKNFISEAILTLSFMLLFMFLIYDLRRTLKRYKTQDHASLLVLKSEIKQPTELANFLQKQTKQNIPEQQFSPKLNLTLKLAIGYYLFTVLVSLFRGGQKYNSAVGINPCGFVGWLILFVHLGISLYIAVYIGNYIKERIKYENEINMSLSMNSMTKSGRTPANSMQVNEDNVWYFLIAGFCAGFVGATLAIGGALILIPVWLKAGIDKDVAASSTATLILISALVAFTVASFNSIYESIPLLTMLFYLILAFAGAAIVKDFIAYLTAKYQLKSLVIILLLIVVITSFIVLMPYQALKMFNNFDDFVEFGELC